jgi:hypothetical protein
MVNANTVAKYEHIYIPVVACILLEMWHDAINALIDRHSLSFHRASFNMDLTCLSQTDGDLYDGY